MGWRGGGGGMDDSTDSSSPSSEPSRIIVLVVNIGVGRLSSTELFTATKSSWEFFLVGRAETVETRPLLSRVLVGGTVLVLGLDESC